MFKTIAELQRFIARQAFGQTTACYVFRYLSRGLAIYPMVIQKDLENGFS